MAGEQLEMARREGAWSRAQREAAAVYRSASFGIGAALVQAVVIPSVVLLTGSNASTREQVAIPILAGALALVLTLLGVLVVQLTAAPVRQRNELREYWPAPHIARPPDIGLSVRDFARVGEGVLEHLSRSYGYTSSQEAEANEWARGVVEFLSEYAPADAKTFIVASEGMKGAPNRVRAQIEALRAIVEGHE